MKEMEGGGLRVIEIIYKFGEKEVLVIEDLGGVNQKEEKIKLEDILKKDSLPEFIESMNGTLDLTREIVSFFPESITTIEEVKKYWGV